MKLDEKMNSIKVKIADIREHYGNEETEIDLYLNDIEVGISLLGTSAKSIVSDKISNIKMLSAVQCLGIQLPIHCLDSLFENFT
ncbi:MAG: hypothetical protein GY710_18560, partial [Desulfobacteraceae bacterium]|nr:hypothetical protein [Desulfobacteraceae bacterium]